MDDLRPALRAYLWAVYLAAAGLTAYAIAGLLLTRGWTLAHLDTPLVFALLTYLCERLTARISSDLGHSMSTVMLIAGVLILPPPYPTLIALGVMLLADLARPLPLYKRLYNVAGATIITGCSSLAFAALAPPLTQWSPAHLAASAPALAVLGLVYVVLDIGGVQVARALAHGQSLAQTLRRTTLKTLIPEGVAIGMGVVSAVAWTYNPLVLPLSLLPIVTVRKTVQAIKQAEDRAERLRAWGEQLEVVVRAGQRFRLQLPRADLVRPLAVAARDVAGAATVLVYLRDADDLAAMDRVLALPVAPPDAPERVPLAHHAGDALVHRSPETPDTLVVELDADGRAVGQLRLLGVAADDGDTWDALTLLANQAAIALQNAALHERVLAQVSIDGLTGLLTHRAFHARLDEDIARCRRTGRPLSLILLDIDGLAAINSAGGLALGDATLTSVAAVIRHAVRTGDIVSRDGGDEFAVLVLDAEREEAIATANRIQEAIRAGSGTPLGVRVSLGVASLPLHGTTCEEVVRAARQALAGAKALGKDCIAEPDDGAGLPGDGVSHLAAELARANLATVKALAAAVDAKDPYTQGHAQRVSRYAVALGRALSLTAPDLDRLELAGLLHDVGKIAVPDAILKKDERLTDEEFAAIREHPVTGERMLAGLPYLSKDILPAVRHHHERWDGRGYPDGLAGAALPLDAAIMAVADAFDAMTSTRTYRPALPVRDAVRRIREGSGTQFAPHVVLAFERALAAGDLLSADRDTIAQARPA